MAQLTVRNLPDDVVHALRVQAARNGRSAEAEHRIILAQALHGAAPDFWAQADAMRSTVRPQRTNSAKLLREMRDSR